MIKKTPDLTMADFKKFVEILKGKQITFPEYQMNCYELLAHKRPPTLRESIQKEWPW